MFALILLASLTFDEIVADIPHDAKSIVVYAMLALFVGFTWHGSRRRPVRPSAEEGQQR